MPAVPRLPAARAVLDRVGLGGWAHEPLWGRVYDWSVEHPALGGLMWQSGIGSDLRLLHAAAAEIGRQPAGSSVLDVPSGGGVALRGLRPGQGVRYVAADISPRMLQRTRASARRHDVAPQVETVLADVGALPFADGEFDLVVSFTGLHCFPDPLAATRELVRVLHPGGVLTGSALMNDTGLRFEGVRRGGRAAGLLGPGATRAELRSWLRAGSMEEVEITTSGAIAYFRAVKG